MTANVEVLGFVEWFCGNHEARLQPAQFLNEGVPLDHAISSRIVACRRLDWLVTHRRPDSLAASRVPLESNEISVGNVTGCGGCHSASVRPILLRRRIRPRLM